MFLKVAFLLIIGVAIERVCADDPERIFGGTNANPGELAYQVSLQMFNGHFCGGTLITRQHVLTAAHCVHDISAPYEDFTVVTGFVDLTQPGQSHKVKSVKVHDNYIHSKLHSWFNDIAIITLEAPIEENDLQKHVPIATVDPEVNSTAIVSGWGMFNMRGETPDHLQKAEVFVIDNQRCSSALSNARIFPTHICTVNRRGIGACKGDSGGPLVYGGKVIGVTSFAIPCALGVPDVFTRVSQYSDFINQAIQSS